MAEQALENYPANLRQGRAGKALRTILHSCILGLLGAAIVHITVLLLLPAISEKNVWSRLGESGGLYRVIPISGEAGERRVLQSTDPYFEAIACRFDLAQGIAHISGAGNIPYWSVSVYNRNGENIYSLNDHATQKGNLDLLLLSPSQMMERRSELAREFDQSVFIDLPVEEGIVVTRAFAPDPSWKPGVSAFIKNITCTGE